MSALKEFANFILLNVANLAATYDRLLAENSDGYPALPAESRMTAARRLIKTVAEACEAETPDPLHHLFEARINTLSLDSSSSDLPQPLTEIECLGQTLTPVVTTLEAGKFLWQMLAEVRATIFKSISFDSTPVSNLAVQPELLSGNNMIDQGPETSSLQQRNLLSTLIDNLPDYIYAKDAESRFILLNTATAHLLGASSVDEVIGKTDFDFFPPELARQFRADEQALMQSDQSLLHHEERLVDSATGQTRWNLSSKIPLRDDKGKVIGLVGINRDITTRKQAEEAMHESQRMLQLVMDNVPQSIFWKSRDLVYLGCNRRFAADAGLDSPEEIIGKVDADLVWREQAELYNADDRRVMETNQAKLNFEEPQTTPNGERIWLQTSKVPLHDAQGNVIGILGMYGDITARKQAEAAVRESQQRFQGLVETLSDWIWEVDQNGIYTYVSPKVKDLLGYEPEEVLGKTPFDFMSPEEAQRVAGVFGLLLAAQQPLVTLENTNQHKDGYPVVFETSGVPFFDADGQFQGYRGAQRNITRRKQLEQQTQQSMARLSGQIQAITEVAQQIAGTLTLKDLFQQVVNLMQTQFGYYHAQIYTLVEGDMVLQAGTGEVGRRLKERNHKISLSAEQSLVIRAVWEGESVLVGDVSQEPIWLPNPLLPETKAELVIPITLGAEVIGVLDVQSDKVGGVNEEDQLLLIGLCGQIAIAVESRRSEDERARLLVEAERRARREQIIREITEQMRAANSLQELARITARELGQRLSAGHAIVELGIEAKTEPTLPANKLSTNGH